VMMIGRTVRIKNGVSEDGQTPSFWNGAIGKVIHTYLAVDERWFVVELPTGQAEHFREFELDLRYLRNGKEKE
jgi:hypothetical protein